MNFDIMVTLVTTGAQTLNFVSFNCLYFGVFTVDFYELYCKGSSDYVKLAALMH